MPSFGAAKRELMPDVTHCHDRYAIPAVKYRMSTFGDKSVRCDGSDLQVAPNVFYRRMGNFTICFELDDIYFAPRTIDSCELARS